MLLTGLAACFYSFVLYFSVEFISGYSFLKYSSIFLFPL